MALKKTKEIEKYIKHWLKEQGLGSYKIKLGTDFAYYHQFEEGKKHRIEVALVTPEDNGFLDNLYRRYKPNFKCDIFLISLFHEIGHDKTWDFFTEEEHEFFDTQKEKIEYLLSICENAEMRDLYFGCADEDRATKWAIDYIESHSEEIRIFWETLRQMILSFYDENGVDISAP